MFKIIAIVFIAQLNYTAMLESREGYVTKDGCEAALSDRLIPLKKYYDDQGLKDQEDEPVVVEVGGKCETPGQPS